MCLFCSLFKGPAKLICLSFIAPAARYDHQERLTAQEAMAHPFFEEVRANEELNGTASK